MAAATRLQLHSALLLLFLAACVPAREASAATRPPRLDTARLAADVQRIAESARPGRLGVGVAVLGAGQEWFLDGDTPLPMQSVFKAPLVAAALERADRGGWALDSVLVLHRADLSVPYSAINDSFPQRTRWTWSELLELAAGSSDNTAADLVLARLGGPPALTDWLRARGIRGIRVDRYEHDQQAEIAGLGPFRPEWASQDSLSAARRSVPPDVQRRARDGYLRGKLDTMTPRGAIAFLLALAEGRLGSPRATAQLLGIMTASQTGPQRLRAALPAGATLAHKTGTGPTLLGVCTAVNDIGIVTLPDGTRVAIAVLYSGSTAPADTREAVLADVGRAVLGALR
jgi:beta-lactamase class A